MTELIKACLRDDEDKLTYLLEQCSPNQKDPSGSTPLIEAIYWANNGNLVFHLLNNGADVDLEDSIGNTALIYAAIRGKIQYVRWLMLYEADVNHQNKNGETAVMMALLYGNLQIAKMLHEDYSADLDMTDANGNDARNYYMDYGYEDE